MAMDFNVAPPSPAPRQETVPQPTGNDQFGTVGFDLLGGATGVAGGAVGATLGTLGEVVNTPWEIVAGEIAQKRLENAMVVGDAKVDPKYVNMVNNGMSVSDVADQMANDGVALTGGIAHDLAVNLFLDPFNLIAMGAGKGFDVAKRSAGIQARMGINHANGVADSAARNGATAEEVAWLKSGTGKEVLGRSYAKVSSGLSGVKRGLAQAILGRAHGIALTAVGVRIAAQVLDAAKIFGKEAEAIDALTTGVNHLTLNGSADLVVQRVFGEVRASALKKAAIIKSAVNGVNDTAAFAEYARFANVDISGPSRALDDLQSEWKQLHEIFATSTAKGRSGEAAVTQQIFNTDTAGMINESIGKAGVHDVLHAQRTMDEVGVARRMEDAKQVQVDENIFHMSSGVTMQEKVAIAQAEFITNMEPIIGKAGAEAAWSKLVQEMGKGVQSDLRALGEIMYASQVMRFGAVAKEFGAAKKGLLAKLNTNILGKLPKVTRNLIAQAQNWTVVARDTMTNVDYKELVAVLKSDAPAAEKAVAAGHAVGSYSILRNAYDAKVFARLVAEDPEKAVKTLLNTLDEFSPGAFAQQVPNTTFRDIEDVLPEVRQMNEAADAGGYKIVFEPDTAATKPNMVYVDNATRDTMRFGVDLWVPITGEAMDLGKGNRNILGQAVDLLMAERRTSGVIANTLTRLQEKVVQQNIPLSRDQVRSLHRTLTDWGFKTKGSIRTAAIDEFSDGTVGIMDKLINETRAVDTASAMQLDQMRKNGELQRLIFYAAEGDLTKVGVTSKFTAKMKGSNKAFGAFFTKWADQMYPGIKFKLSPIFGMQEVIESKWWNLMRGYQDEWRIKMPTGDIRFGNKRFYDVVDPLTGKTERLDSLEIISEALVADRKELMFAQEMAAINMYFAGQTTDAVLRFGNNESLVKGLAAGFQTQNIGSYKAQDYLKYVAAESLDELASNLSKGMEAHAPHQWATWLKMAGGDRKGATLLFMRERQYLIKNRSAARNVWEHNKPLGVGFGRQYDDNPIKNLDTTRRELSKLLSSKDAKKRKDGLDRLSVRLSAIHADAAAIGYSPELLTGVQDAMVAVEKAKNMRMTAKGDFANATKKAYSDAMESIDGIAGRMRLEFEAAVTRKNAVKNALMADGISQPLATEMASLFVVAERRGEMLPEISNAVRDAVAGKKTIDTQTLTATKDHLFKIRMARTEEETLWNAIGYGLDGAMQNADKTHFFNPGRGFVERSMNHPVFGLYPTSYMFGKVLPEYARMLFLSPQRSVAGVVLAPWQAILRGASFGKFNPEDWGKYAPLVGFAAARKIREAMVNGIQQDGQRERNPLTYMIANILIPGLPTDISTAFSVPVKRTAEAVKTNLEGGQADVIGSAMYGTQQAFLGTIGVSRLGKQVTDIVGYTADQVTKAGSNNPVEYAGNVIGDMAESLHDILLNVNKK